MTEFQFRVEMSVGQDIRIVDADGYRTENDWVSFFRKPPQGGQQEYWRVNRSFVVSIETKRGDAR